VSHVLAVLPLIVVVLIASGCGGGDSTETVTQVRTQTSAEPLTKAEYIAQADAICQQYQALGDKTDQMLSALGTIDSDEEAEQAAGIVRQSVVELRPTVQALQRLEPPPRDAQVIGTYLSIVSAQLGENADLADAYEAHDAPESQTIVDRIARDTAKQEGLAQGYGFKVCGHYD
jgi:hypothetical protein